MYGRLEITADLRGSGVLAGDCSAVPEWDDLEAVLGGFGVSGDPMSVSWFVVTFDDQSHHPVG